MDDFTEKKIAFVAGIATDLGKAIFVVGLASYFFEGFGLPWRILLGALILVLLAGGIWMYPNTGGD